ncbi:MAG TPA: gamma-glutamyl-gamma-aminobutyrate hydrolase family protein [Candidatus Nitrosotalea sp.]|nr:gamma-glutamyl-gamma-aminobutyrate hydrolase family protein [Candidatus Nitrosotalea sp.]
MLVVDNGSVYTDSIIESLDLYGIQHRRIPFDRLTEGDIASGGHVILSGRRRNDPTMNATNSRLVRLCLGEKRPLLGICYGAEILAITLGGTIKKMEGHRQGLRTAQVVRDNPLCSGKIEVFESHSYKVASADEKFEILASSDECKFEAFRYGDTSIFGTQFHPEMSSDGREILRRFSEIK